MQNTFSIIFKRCHSLLNCLKPRIQVPSLVQDNLIIVAPVKQQRHITVRSKIFHFKIQKQDDNKKSLDEGKTKTQQGGDTPPSSIASKACHDIVCIPVGFDSLAPICPLLQRLLQFHSL